MPTGTLDSSNVEVAVTGAVYLAPLGTTLPTDSEVALHASFANVGYIGEDGITESPDADTNEIQAWQNGDIVRTIQTSHSISYQFTMIETNEHSLKAYYGNYNAGNVKITGEQLPRQALVIETIDQGMLRRRVAEIAQVTDRGDVELVGTDATGYEVTVTCYPGSDGLTKVDIFAPVSIDES